MKKHIVCLSLVLLSVLACAAPESPRTEHANVVADVTAALATQTENWNRGDIDAFMQGYWHDEDVRFGSGGDIKRGWSTVLNDYKLRYPDRSAMGVLQTADLEVTEISSDAALIFGRWIVTAGESDYCGLFTLVVRKIENRWVIVHDHTSSAVGPMADARRCSDIKAST